MLKTNYGMGILILASMLLATGCTLGGGGGGGGSSQSYLGGTQALDMQFVNGAPPPYIFDAGTFDFDVQVKLENMGEIDIAGGDYNVDIVGIDLALFGLTTEVPATSDLLGRYLDPEGNVIPGSIAYWTWSSAGYTGTVVGNTPYTIWAEACYVYGSEAQAFLCYKIDDPLDQDEQSICLIRENKDVQNAGSPIQITRLSESPMGTGKISFTFDITHSGSGQLYAPGAATCEDTITTENVVNVVVTTGTGTLDCNFPGGSGTTGAVQLYDGHFTLRCTETMPGNSNWESLVTITTSYDYKNKINKELIVKSSS